MSVHEFVDGCEICESLKPDDNGNFGFGPDDYENRACICGSVMDAHEWAVHPHARFDHTEHYVVPDTVCLAYSEKTEQEKNLEYDD